MNLFPDGFFADICRVQAPTLCCMSRAEFERVIEWHKANWEEHDFDKQTELGEFRFTGKVQGLKMARKVTVAPWVLDEYRSIVYESLDVPMFIRAFRELGMGG